MYKNTVKALLLLTLTNDAQNLLEETQSLCKHCKSYSCI